MEAKQMYYTTLSAYNETFVWVGILFTILFIVTLLIALKNKKKQFLLNSVMGLSLFWVAWVWLFITTWFHNYSLLDEYPMVIWPLFMEPLWTILLSVAAIMLFKDTFHKKSMEISLPANTWEKLMVVAFLLVSIFSPLYYLALGFTYPVVMFIGIGPFPTFIFCGVLLASSMPKVNRWLVLILMLAIFGSIPSLAGGLYENIILIPPFIYILIKLVLNWKSSKIYEKQLS